MRDDIMMFLHHAGHIHRRIIQAKMDQEGISWGQPPVLMYLSDHDGCIQRDIAQNCHIKAATVSSVLDNMEQSGYIQRCSMAGDRRVQQVFLTATGREKGRMVRESILTFEQRCLQDIAPEDVAVFRSVLSKIIANLQIMDAETGGKDDKAEVEHGKNS